MNTNDSVASAESAIPAAPSVPAPPASRPRRWPWIVLAGCAFLFGFACGSGLTLAGVLHRVRQSLRHPEMRSERAAQFLNRRLKLTPEQQKQVTAILQEQNRELGKLRRETMPRVAERLQATRDAVDQVLTPEQQQRWHTMADEFRRKLQPAVVGGGAAGP
jgi:Spy/CpxP family protein refolding chaperone